MEALAPMKRQRGGAMLFVLIMVGLMTVAILASVELGTSAATTIGRQESDARARYAFEGAVQVFLSEFRKGIKTLPSQSVYTVGDLKVDLKATDDSANKPHTIRFQGTTTIAGRSYQFVDITGDRLDPTPLDYALFVNGAVTINKAVTLGSAGTLGDMSVNGSVTAIATPFVVNGDLETTGMTAPTATVTGNVLTGETALTFTTPNSLDYLTAALLSLTSNSLTNYLFPSTVPYPLLYRLGNLDLKGTITGKGTIYATGTVNITGDLTYADANARLVVIAGTGITLQSAAKNVSGMFYTSGTFRNDGDTVISPGAVAAGALSMNGTLTITHDPALWNDRSEAVKHRVPGFWP